MYYFWYDNTPTFLILFNIFILILNFFNFNKNLLFVFTSVSEGGGIVHCNESRAISTTRTIFRLNNNQSRAYEDYLFTFLDPFT